MPGLNDTPAYSQSEKSRAKLEAAMAIVLAAQIIGLEVVTVKNDRIVRAAAPS